MSFWKMIMKTRKKVRLENLFWARDREQMMSEESNKYNIKQWSVKPVGRRSVTKLQREVLKVEAAIESSSESGTPQKENLREIKKCKN
ncbi:hypothetical protein RCL_jg18947.t1 [Rhizophagus clarus]|uniref:Uncharacterized protein n=1 Tax=Rhizophagus clarus TaxID=94130 RepID=A0A8H3R2S1_9GLOM|nr:hypothetical protein RCL_jg18947.t1 [Rhizophagus clarus]